MDPNGVANIKIHHALRINSKRHFKYLLKALLFSQLQVKAWDPIQDKVSLQKYKGNKMMYMSSQITRNIEGDCNTLSAMAFEGEPFIWSRISVC